MGVVVPFERKSLESSEFLGLDRGKVVDLTHVREDDSRRLGYKAKRFDGCFPGFSDAVQRGCVNVNTAVNMASVFPFSLWGVYAVVGKASLEVLEGHLDNLTSNVPCMVSRDERRTSNNREYL